MFHKKTLTYLLLLSYSYLYASTCENPAVAKDNLNKNFRYGCFCGKEYPNIEHSSKKEYRELNRTQREEVILEYQKIDVYDDIDSICKEHDICYLYYGKEAKVCNDKAYNSFSTIEKKFSKLSKIDKSNKQCKNLAYDIGSIFHTIFLPADDEDTIFDFGMLMFNGAITASNKVLQESVDTINSSDAPRYPLKNQRCLVDKKNRKKPLP